MLLKALLLISQIAPVSPPAVQPAIHDSTLGPQKYLGLTPQDQPKYLGLLSSQNQKQLLWAADQVDALAMKTRVNELVSASGQNPWIPILVVDHSISDEFDSHFYSEEKLEHQSVTQFSDEIHAPRVLTEDEEQRASEYATHGLAVMSLIALKSPQSMITDGAILSIIGHRKGHSATDPEQQIRQLKSELQQKGEEKLVEELRIHAKSIFGDLLRICKAHPDRSGGLTLINFSAGTLYDQNPLNPKSSQFRFESLASEEIQQMGEEGCFIVNAAGNSGYRHSHKNDPKDAFLRVGASDFDGKEWKGSSVSELLAPGVNVFVLSDKSSLSWSDRISSTQYRNCIPSEGLSQPTYCVPRSGTSLAAPIVTGIAAQVLRVLMTQEHFKNLSHPNQVVLLNTILQRSSQINPELPGVINGYSAVELANRWNQLESNQERKQFMSQGNELQVYE